LCLVLLPVGCEEQAARPGPTAARPGPTAARPGPTATATTASSSKPKIASLRVSKRGTFLGTVTFAANNEPSLKLEAGVEGSAADKLKKRIAAIASSQSVAADTEVHHPNGDRDYGTVVTPMHHADFREMVVRNLLDAHFEVKRVAMP
jgi:hypothetical protein